MRDWESFIEDIKEKVAEALDYFCWEITGDTPLDCYSAHQDRDLYDLAEEFVGWSSFGITKRDLERLREAPDNIYNRYSKELQKEIEKVVESLHRESSKGD